MLCFPTFKNFFMEKLFELEFKISPYSFFQTNSAGAEKLYGIVKDFAGNVQEKTVFDLYCGTGTIGQIMAKEARIESVFRYRNLYAKAIAAVANGLDIATVATHEFAFDDIQAAFEAAINDKENVVKAVIKL